MSVAVAGNHNFCKTGFKVEKRLINNTHTTNSASVHTQTDKHTLDKHKTTKHTLDAHDTYRETHDTHSEREVAEALPLTRFRVQGLGCIAHTEREVAEALPLALLV